MNTTTSFLLLAVFILLYTIIIELFTILFRLTGLTYETARMQVISLLTNCGYTTAESEVILSNQRRRQLAQITMLFGYSFTVIIVSAIVNAFFSLSRNELDSILPPILLMAGLVLLALMVARLTPVRSCMNHLVERTANKMMFGKNSNVTVLVDTYGKNAIVEVFLEHVPARLRGVPLDRSGLREEMNVHVLHLKRGADTHNIAPDTIFVSGDVLLLFGTYKNIRSIFENVQD